MNESRQSGQVLVLAVFAFVVICGFASLTIDVGLLFRERRSVQNAVDAAALAGAQELPDSGTTAVKIAKQYAISNDNALDDSKVKVSFRCIVGDRDGNGVPDPGDVPIVCDPGGATFHCSGGTCWSYCVFTGSNKCNTIVVSAKNDVPFYFGPVLSVFGGKDECFLDACSTGSLLASACVGPCGGPPTQPLDVIMVIDRSSSMSASDLANAKAGAKSVLEMFDSTRQQVGLAVLGASNPSSPCGDLDPASGGSWLTVPLSSNYKNADGTLNNSSTLVSRINCLTTSSQGTNLGSPLNDAAFNRNDAVTELTANGRPGVKQGIILFSDGAATKPDPLPVAGSTGTLNCAAQGAVTTGSGDNNGFQSGSGNACTDGSGQAVDTDSGTNTNLSCTDSGKDRHIFRDYNISVPANATITGVSVRLDAWVDSTSSSSRYLCGQVSWNGGTSWSGTKQTGNLTTTQSSYSLGGSSDNWGHTWVASETSNSNFRLRITSVANSTSRDFSLDWAAVTVHYTTPGTVDGPCDYANDQADVAKAADIEVFTIGFGIETETCVEPATLYNGLPVADLLGDMATNSADDRGHCVSQATADAENEDGDNFFCSPRSSDLRAVFTAAAVQLSGGTRLVPIFGDE